MQDYYDIAQELKRLVGEAMRNEVSMYELCGELLILSDYYKNMYEAKLLENLRD